MSEILAKKLRLKPGQKITILNRPGKEYFSEYDVSEAVLQPSLDLIILFVKNLEELTVETMKLVERDCLSTGGRLLIAYPKKGNRLFDTYVHRDDILPALGAADDGYIRGSDYKFNQMVSLDENYTIVGIKHEKKARPKKTVSQHVDDYVHLIPDLEKELASEKEALCFFQSLTPGYQKNWARYLYSAKFEETRDKRKKEITGLLKQGVKSRESVR